MRIIHAEGLSAFPLGRLGENEATTVVFDVTKWRAEFGEGVFSLLNRRSGDSTAYPCVVEQDEKEVRWEIKSADVSMTGYGQCELTYTVGDTVVKSEVFKTFVDTALVSGADVPEPCEDWVQEILNAVERAESTEQEMPTELSELSDDSTHRLVTDAEKTAWSGKYSKPSGGIPASDLADEVKLVPAGGSIDQVLTKTENGYGWADAQGGEGDMLASVYDPQGKEDDIFAYADTAKPVIINMVTNRSGTLLSGAEKLRNLDPEKQVLLIWSIAADRAGAANKQYIIPLVNYIFRETSKLYVKAYFAGVTHGGYIDWVELEIAYEDGGDETEYELISWTHGTDDPIIGDIATIRSGAALGATAVQSETDPTVPSWAKQENKPTYTASEVGARPSTWTPTKSDVGLGNLDNVRQYSASNPPPYPVTSVNGQTGGVVLNYITYDEEEE